MKPFRTSPTARIISGAIAFALIAGGLVPTLGLAAEQAVPLVLLASVGACIFALVLGVYDHPGAVALSAMLLPLVLWPYTMVFIYTATARPAWALALSVAGLGVLAATLVAGVTVSDPASRAQRITRTERSA